LISPSGTQPRDGNGWPPFMQNHCKASKQVWAQAGQSGRLYSSNSPTLPNVLTLGMVSAWLLVLLLW